MRGYKVFNPDWTCRDFQYEVGKTYKLNTTPMCCVVGFHFCTDLKECFNYYSFDPHNKVAEVEATGDINAQSDGSKHCTNEITIVREITWEEVLRLVNTGKACTGYFNSGNYNSGNWNSGNRNSGNCNSGNWNSGSWNSGSCNSGSCNSGNCNTGNYNTGHCNTGNYNTGNYNTGNWNIGDWNTTSHSNGYFNTKEQEIFLFNKPSGMTYNQWAVTDAKRLLDNIRNCPLTWVCSTDMTSKEKAKHPEYKTTGGYLKTVNMSDAAQVWWENLTVEQREIIKAIPNFDADIFYECTGIDLRKGENKCYE